MSDAHAQPATANALDGRHKCAAVAVALVWMVIAARLVYLHALRGPAFGRQSARQQFFAVPLPPRPGDITDRRGRVLATSVPADSLWVNPARVADAGSAAKSLAAILDVDGDQLAQRIERGRRRQFLWVKRRLTDEQATAVRALKLPPDAWGFRTEYRRHYPQGPLAAHLLGFRDVDGEGQGGIEQAYDRELKGATGRRTMRRDARGRVVEVLDESSQPAKAGRNVELTLDIVLQLDAERALDALMTRWKPKSAGVIVMDPRTAEVLAMASRPSFDPNQPAGVPADAWKNVNTASLFEPGSTFKPFVVAWGLHTGVLKPNETFHCGDGQYRMGRRVLHDHHPYGVLSVRDILVKSSNIGMAKIGERLTNSGLYAAASRFGFGNRTGSGLPGELDGLLRPLNVWTSYSTGSIPMGQELAVTPLQLITAHAALANGGTLKAPRFVRRTGSETARTPGFRESPSPSSWDRFGQSDSAAETRPQIPGFSRGANVPPAITTRVVDRETAHWVVREAMTDVVKRGTGKRARLPGYEVFGKTGTAQKTDPRTGRYFRNRHVCAFVGGAPADNPRVLVLVVVNEPTAAGSHYGGTVAAPTAARILRQSLAHLGVPARVARTDR